MSYRGDEQEFGCTRCGRCDCRCDQHPVEPEACRDCGGDGLNHVDPRDGGSCPRCGGAGVEGGYASLREWFADAPAPKPAGEILDLRPRFTHIAETQPWA
jgi:hypothetical protein